MLELVIIIQSNVTDGLCGGIKIGIITDLKTLKKAAKSQG